MSNRFFSLIEQRIADSMSSKMFLIFSCQPIGEEVLYINHLQFLFHFYPKSIFMAQLLIMYVSEQKEQIRVS